jgi:hypothetical protein
MDSVIVFSAMGGDAMRLTARIKKRRADFWEALGDDGNNGIEELLKLYWWWGSDTADFFFDKFVLAGLRAQLCFDRGKVFQYWRTKLVFAQEHGAGLEAWQTRTRRGDSAGSASARWIDCPRGARARFQGRDRTTEQAK